MLSVLVGALATPASATTVYTVDTTEDSGLAAPAGTACVDAASGNCSLRAAVEAVDNSGGGTIDFATPGLTYTLAPSLGTLDFGSLVTPGGTYVINGDGSVIEASQPGSCTSASPSTCFGVISLDEGTLGSQTFSLGGLTISGGEVATVGGAGVLAGGTGDSYTFTNDTIENDTIDAVSNTGEVPGAGVSIGAASSVTVTDCTFSNDTGGGSVPTVYGGGLYIATLDGNAVTATVSGSTFASDTVSNALGGGGGIYLDTSASTGSTITVSGSTFSSDEATSGSSSIAGGGAILDLGGTNDTLDAYSNSFVSDSVTASGEGGAINVLGGSANVNGNRFVANTAAVTDGQALAVEDGSPPVPVVNADYNWWAANAQPTAVEAEGVTVNHWIELRVSAATSPATAGEPDVITADLSHDEAGNAYAAHPVPSGENVTFGGSAGSYALGASRTLTNDSATDTLTASSTGGDYNPAGVSVSMDGVTVEVPLVVDEQPGITSLSSTTWTTGEPDSFQVTATGYPAPTFSVSGQPSFLSLDSTTGVLSGTPTASDAGVYHFSVGASNGVAPAATQPFTLTVERAPLPTVTSLTPSSGPVGGGTRITITGSGFTPGSQVVIGQGGGSGTAVGATNVDLVSSSEIKATTPPSARAGTFYLYVEAASGTSLPTGNSEFTFGAPTVSRIEPASGPVAGGTPVTITGTDFVPGATVAIGQGGGAPIAATNVDVVSGTEITADTGAARRAGTFYLYVTENGVSNGVSSADRFTYEAPTVAGITPYIGPGTGGTFVTLQGTGFVTGMTVLVAQGSGPYRGAVPATRVDVSSSSGLTAYTGAATRTGTFDVYVEVDGVASPADKAVTFTYTTPIALPSGPRFSGCFLALHATSGAGSRGVGSALTPALRTVCGSLGSVSPARAERIWAADIVI